MDETAELSWDGWIQQTLGTVIGAAANKEFAPQGMQNYQTYQVDQYGRVVANGQPNYAPVAQNNNTMTTMMIIGAVVVAALFLVKS